MNTFSRILSSNIIKILRYICTNGLIGMYYPGIAAIRLAINGG